MLHSFGGWQLHDNYFGAPGGTDPVTGKIDSVEFQYSFSFGQLFWYPQAFWGQGPDLIVVAVRDVQPRRTRRGTNDRTTASTS